MAHGTKAALSKTAIGIRTEAGGRTVTSVATVIERAVKAAGLLEKYMAADFPGNGGTIPPQSPVDLFKGSRIIKHEFDSNALKSTPLFVRITSVARRRQG